MAEHIPWHTQHREPLGMDELYFDFVFEGEDTVCRVSADSAEICRDRTELIVKACNSHEELLRVCGELRREIETAWACGDLIKIPHESARMWQLAKWSDRLQAAIEKAERR